MAEAMSADATASPSAVPGLRRKHGDELAMTATSCMARTKIANVALPYYTKDTCRPRRTDQGGVTSYIVARRDHDRAGWLVRQPFGGRKRIFISPARPAVHDRLGDVRPAQTSNQMVAVPLCRGVRRGAGAGARQ